MIPHKELDEGEIEDGVSINDSPDKLECPEVSDQQVQILHMQENEEESDEDEEDEEEN